MTCRKNSAVVGSHSRDAFWSSVIVLGVQMSPDEEAGICRFTIFVVSIYDRRKREVSEVELQFATTLLPFLTTKLRLRLLFNVFDIDIAFLIKDPIDRSLNRLTRPKAVSL